MKDRNIIIAILVCALLALAACGTINKETEGSGASAQIPNPWTETSDLEEAKKATGIDYDPPVEGSVPEQLSFKTYRYTDRILETVYEGGGAEMIVRVSKELSGTDLSGDYNTYSKEWDENFKGLVVHCKGDGTFVSCANADLEDMHFAVLYDAGTEGKGLDSESLKSVFMGMQAVPLP